MRKKNEIIEVSASDLSNYLSCKHLSELDLLAANGKIKAPPFNNPHAETFQKLGLEHEAAYVDHLIKAGFNVVLLDEVQDKDYLNSFNKTLEAMKTGPDYIVQATLRLDQYFGRADILRKVHIKSILGDFSYEIVDTKLSRETKASSILQLCLYSEMLEHMQGLAPEYLAVVTPGTNFKPEEYRLDDFKAYYRLIRTSLLRVIDQYDEQTHIYPEPRDHCDVCKWFEVCNTRRRNDDHLSFVAGLTSSQRKELAELDIKTLKDFATTKIEINNESILRSKEQARLQLEARNNGVPSFEVLPLVDMKGFYRLPEPNAGDIFFDLEGDAFYGNSGLEYLWGYCEVGPAEKITYHHRWAYNFEQEKSAFIHFMTMLVARAEAFPGMKVYHYAPYEPSALKRLMGRYGVMEAELDQLLREERFVDLYSITRQSLRAGIEKYSIKDLEQFYNFTRKSALRSLGPHKRHVEHTIELNQVDKINPDSLSAVQIYNQDDCESTFYLRQWLESLRPSELPRPEQPLGEVNVELSAKLQKMNDLRDQLQKGINPLPEERSNVENAVWLLSELISFYRREDKVVYWEKFRLQELDPLELMDEKAGLAGLTYKGVVGGTPACPIDRYQFTPQEVDIRDKDVFIEGGMNDKKDFKIGSWEELNLEEGYIDIKKMKATKDIHPASIWSWGIVPTEKKADKIIELAEFVLANKMEDDALEYKAAREILLHKSPDLTSVVSSSLPSLERAKEMAINLNHSFLAIQGPPGTGKSYSASRVILALLEKGHKVGVTALSHKVITNLLVKTHEASSQEKITANIFQKNEDREHDFISYLKNAQEVEQTLIQESNVVIGGTDFLWTSMPSQSVDYLVIDEAGQFSRAALLAISHCTKNIIFLGDGAQLTQPLKGSHPDGCDVSVLDYIVGNNKTLPLEKGVFLEKTYRLHPSICEFNSELFYDNRLRSVDGNQVQLIQGPTRYSNKALVIEPVEHAGNSNYSNEEILKIKEIVSELLKPGVTCSRNNNGKTETHQVTAEDIKIVAPYNSQVNRLKKELPNIKIGTVDKFQGQEAPIVIYSVTTSSSEEAPRGMDFLYSGNRLNVAVSRAECLFIMVCSPSIFEVDCKSPKQMKLANAYARFKEMAK
jgi:predicted RecB family nuclease